MAVDVEQVDYRITVEVAVAKHDEAVGLMLKIANLVEREGWDTDTITFERKVVSWEEA